MKNHANILDARALPACAEPPLMRKKSIPFHGLYCALSEMKGMDFIVITTKQRAQLRALVNPMETILQIGKGGIIDTTVVQVDDALTARELIKLRCLETAPCTAREAAQELAVRLNADIVQVIGSRFSLYRRNPENPKIEL